MELKDELPEQEMPNCCSIAMDSDAEILSLNYLWQVVSTCSDMPLKITRSLLELYRNRHDRTQATCKKQRVGEYHMCPKCSIPWIGGFNQPRLTSHLRNAKKIKKLLRLRNTRKNKLNHSEKLQISLYEKKQNAIFVKCAICGYKSLQCCLLQIKSKDKFTAICSTTTVSRKNRKRNIKEVNAGLNIVNAAQLPTSKRDAIISKRPKVKDSVTSTNMVSGPTKRNESTLQFIEKKRPSKARILLPGDIDICQNLSSIPFNSLDVPDKRTLLHRQRKLVRSAKKESQKLKLKNISNLRRAVLKDQYGGVQENSLEKFIKSLNTPVYK